MINISGENIDLGRIKSSPSYTYMITNNDTENSILKTTILLDGEEIESFNQENGVEYTYFLSEDIFKELQNTITSTLVIEVTNGADSARREITFTKVENSSPTIPNKIEFSLLDGEVEYKTGSKVLITWSESTDLDNDIVTYDLYFYNGNQWITVKGNYNELEYQYEVPIVGEIPNAKFRVRAFDGTIYSDFIESSEFAINISNEVYEFTLSGQDEDLGEKYESFSISYSFNDTNLNNSISLFEKIDGLYTNQIFKAERNKVYTLDLSSRWKNFEPITHSIEIVANNGEEVLIRKYFFNKCIKTQHLPTISGKDENLGIIKQAFKKEYTINDLEQNTQLKIEERLDGNVLKTIDNAIRNNKYSFSIEESWETLSVGIHQASIIVSDEAFNSVVRNYTFYKEGEATNDTNSVNRKYLYNEDQYLNVKLKLFKPNKELVCILNTSENNYVKNLVKTDTMNDSSKLVFNMDSENQYITKSSNEMLIQIVGSNQYFIIKNISYNDGETSEMSIECVSEEDELKGILVEAIDLDVGSPEQIFNNIKNAVKSCEINYKWKGTDVPANKCRSIEIENECSVFEALLNMCEKFNGWLEFSTDEDGQKWIYLRTNEIDNGKFITKGRGLKELNISYDTTNIITRMSGFGGNDKDTGNEINIASVNPTQKHFIEDYSFYLANGMTIEEIKQTPRCLQEAIYRDTLLIDEIDLFKATEEELQKCCIPKIDGTIALIDYSISDNSSLTEPLIGERVLVIDEDIKFSMSCRIQSIERKFTENPYDVSTTISNLISYDSILKDFVHTSETVDRITSTDDNGDPYVPEDKVKDSDGICIRQKVGDLESHLDLTAERLQTDFNNYANDTHSQFLQTAEKFNMTVEKDEFGTLMEQNSESWLYCFNHASSYIKFDSTGIWCEDKAFGSGYTCLSSQGLVHMDDKDDPLGKKYHYLTDIGDVAIRCTNLSGYTVIKIPLPSKFQYLKTEEISITCSIKKVYKEGAYIPYWFGGYAGLTSDRCIKISAMSMWYPWERGELLCGNIDISYTLIG